MMEAARTSETLVNFYQTTWCYNPEDSCLITSLVCTLCKEHITKKTFFTLKEIKLQLTESNKLSYILNSKMKTQRFTYYEYILRMINELITKHILQYKPNFKGMKIKKEMQDCFNNFLSEIRLEQIHMTKPRTSQTTNY
jgi:hypothetical protein